MPSNRPRVVILGAGYAGVRAVYELAREPGSQDLDITLVNNDRFHLDTSALYEVASAYLEHESLLSSETVRDSVSVDLDTIFSGRPLTVLVNVVTAIDTQQRLVLMHDQQTLSYDVLCLCLGAKVATYHVPGVAEFSFSVKSLHESLELRAHMVRQFHLAATLPAAARQAALRLVVAGGGATGVETAAELCGHIRHQCQKLQLDPAEAQVVLVEASPEILKTVPAHVRDAARQRLDELGVELLTGTAIVRVTAEGVALKDGRTLRSHTVIWAGGLQPHPVLVRSQLPLKGWGVLVTSTLQVVGHPTIFAAGDAAVLETGSEAVPATVSVAYTQGSLLARNIRHQQRGETLETYHYRNIGALLALGSMRAAVTLAGERGFVGWLPWLAKKLLALRYWYWYLPLPAAWKFWRRGMWMQHQND